MFKNKKFILKKNFKKRKQKKIYILSHYFFKNFFSKNNIQQLSRNRVIIKNKQSEKIYRTLLIYLSKKLNFINNESYSVRSWEMIIGVWLKSYVNFFFKNYEFIKFYFKKNKNIITMPATRSTLLSPNNTLDSLFYQKDFKYNLILISKIIEFFYSNKIIFLRKPKLVFQVSNLKEIILNFNRNQNIFFYLFKFYNLIFKKKYFFISHTYLNFFQEKKLEIYLGQFPTFYITPKVNYSKNINNSKRDLFDFKNSKEKNLLNFIKFNIKYYIPKCFVEDYNKIKNLSLSNVYPKKPRFIFTSNLNSYDEIFKIFMASQAKKNVPIIIGQHGNNYFTRIFSNYLPELKYSDYFFSWGFKKKKIKNFFNFKAINLSLKKTSKSKLLILLHSLDEFNEDPTYSNLEHLYDLKDFVISLKKLDNKIKKETIIRLPRFFNVNKFSVKYQELFKDLRIKIDNGEENIKNLIEVSKLCIFNYDSTGFLEYNLNNIPSLILEKKKYINSINKHHVKKYKELIKNKILFTESTKLVNQVNKNWDKINNWWNSPKTKHAINFYNKKLNVKSNEDPIKILADNLKKIN